MSKGLKALEKIKNLPMKEQYKSDYNGGFTYCTVSDICGKEIKTIETATEALEIILELTEPKLYKMDGKPMIRLNCGKIGACYPLTKEQYKLLKNLLEQKG